MEVCATTFPPPVTACEMPELATRKIGMPYSAARTGATRECSSCSCRPHSSTSIVGTIKQLRALFHQPVGDARVAQVVADADADFSPRRIPDFLFRRGQAVVEKLDRHALGLLENNLAVRADDEGGVVINMVGHKIFSADDEKARMCRGTSFSANREPRRRACIRSRRKSARWCFLPGLDRAFLELCFRAEIPFGCRQC